MVKESLLNPATVLIYGDSNSVGYIPGSYNPDTNTYRRFTKNIRWSGRVQLALPHLEIIEAGLNGRTIATEDNEWPDRCGMRHLPLMLEQFAPLAVLIIALGTNELKAKYQNTPASIANNLEQLIQTARKLNFIEKAPKPQIILLSPPLITREDSFGQEFAGAIAKHQQLAVLYAKLANQHGLINIDCSTIEPSPDGIHLTADGHQMIAQKLIPILDSLT